MKRHECPLRLGRATLQHTANCESKLFVLSATLISS